MTTLREAQKDPEKMKQFIEEQEKAHADDAPFDQQKFDETLKKVTKENS